ncbi:CST complex subunit CTC1-like isoform X2 [Strongylocentrotus purpuratus]|uniref:CST complex subunit CTC1 n=1 Tax=Strongylocentrotus purpuratus TaxID=7668 RepID=A0A7M7N9Q1_STRPU|nr:CST complex subunit CTC1-like isoform X2 [Strongylocentrotus purpuratus]
MDVRGVCVIAKSPLLRIHGNALFLTEIQTGSSPGSKQFILARGDEATSFYGGIHVGSFYDLNNVTPTTITKGTDRPRKILLLSAFSKITACNKDDITMETNIPTCQGIITKCIDQTLGIYELSSNNRLYLTYQYDGKSHLPSIPLGSEVTIHNAHRIHASDRESELIRDCENIVCCMRSSVKIEGKLKQQQPTKEKSSNVQRVLLPLCGKLFPSLTVLVWLQHQAIPTLLQKLVPDILKLKEMLPVLVQLLTTKMTSNDLPIIKERKRNPYEDFLSHDTACFFSQPMNDIPKTVPCTFPKAIELADCFESPPTDGSSHITSLNQSGWTCSVLRSCDMPTHMALVAKLCCKGTDGRLFLSDSTGSIPCTLAKILPLKERTKSCNESNRGDKTEKTDKEPRSSTSSCFPQPCLNHLLRIDDFVVIRESRTSSNSHNRNEDRSESEMDIEGGVKDSSRSKVNVYVMFSPRKAVCLNRGTERAASPGCIRPRRRKRRSSKSEGSPLESIISEKFLLRSRRQFLHREQRDESRAGSATPSFYSDILILDSNHPKRAKKDAVPRPGEGDRDGEMDVDGRVGKKQERIDDGRAALLCFHGDAVRWYNFLREGQMYRMDCKNEDMETHVVPSVMKLSKKRMTQPIYIITAFSQLQALQNLLQAMNRTSSSESGQPNKGKQRHHHILSSISGMITRKTVTESSMEEAHTSKEEATGQRSSIQLETDDITAQTTVSVSVPTHIHDDTLGLLPGTTLSIRNCLKKVDPGIAVTYDIGPLTSIQVDSFCTKSFKEIATSPDTYHSSHQTRILPTMRQRSFLYHMIQDTTRDSTTFNWIYAHITLITKLVLRWICNHCGRNDCKCPNTRRQGGKIITQILLAVDDGTGECLIWSNQPNVLSAALGLTPREWTMLEDCCSGPNKELVYHKWAKGRKEEYDWEAATGSGPRQSRLALAVSKLCHHYCIQHSLWFKTRRFRESTKDVSPESEKSAWPAGLVLCCEEVSR